MSTQSVILSSVEIYAPANKIWDKLLHDSRPTESGFGCRLESDWAVGSAVLEKSVPRNELVAQGTLLTCEPEHTLKFTIAGAGDTMGEPGTITFSLTREGDLTTVNLSVEHAAFMQSADKQQIALARRGWETVLAKLKDLAEADS